MHTVDAAIKKAWTRLMSGRLSVAPVRMAFASAVYDTNPSVLAFCASSSASLSLRDVRCGS